MVASAGELLKKPSGARCLEVLTEWLVLWFAGAGRVVAWREAGMAQRRPWAVDDGLWEPIDPLLPEGRAPVPAPGPAAAG
jgi:hypothetical protein